MHINGVAVVDQRWRRGRRASTRSHKPMEAASFPYRTFGRDRLTVHEKRHLDPTRAGKLKPVVRIPWRRSCHGDIQAPARCGRSACKRWPSPMPRPRNPARAPPHPELPVAFDEARIELFRHKFIGPHQPREKAQYWSWVPRRPSAPAPPRACRNAPLRGRRVSDELGDHRIVVGRDRAALLARRYRPATLAGGIAAPRACPVDGRKPRSGSSA